MSKVTVSTDSYCTPEWLARRVGRFDTDPCSNSRSHIDAAVSYSLEDNTDGLILPWHGRTWMNHPYSNPMPWMRKLSYERVMKRCTESVVLAKLDPSTAWWGELTRDRACDLWIFKARINFDIPPEVLAEMQRAHEAKGRTGKVSTSNNFASCIVHHRNPATAGLELHDVAQLWS